MNKNTNKLINTIHYISGFATGLFTGIITTVTSVIVICNIIKSDDSEIEFNDSTTDTNSDKQDFTEIK